MSSVEASPQRTSEPWNPVGLLNWSAITRRTLLWTQVKAYVENFAPASGRYF